ncbi:hypothetical protein BASA81_001775 [Batrachochytrium salamandrivorans]|nr:hypothetical protein BASA81_001775 [Batrachochytrium salamandrivorans]
MGDALPSPLFLIKENLSDESPFCRHLMLLTECSSAARLLFDCDLVNRGKTIVLIGSQFPRDVSSELRMVRQINEIKRAMQSGSTVVLVNHEGIFPSLYDVLNMRYTTKTNGDTGKVVRMLRLAVGNRSQWCSVGDGFKIVVVVETKDAYEKLDLPLLNRFEKQMLRPTDALMMDANAMFKLTKLHEYVLEIETESGFQFPFVGMHEQTLASLVLSSPKECTVEELQRELNGLISPFAKTLCPTRQFPTLSDNNENGAYIFSHQRQHQRLLVLTFSSTHDFDLLMRKRAHNLEDETVLALSGVTSELEFIHALRQNPHRTKYVQCDPLTTPQNTIEHARYLALHECQSRPQLAVVFIIHLPPATGRLKRTYQVDFQPNWKTIFVDDLLLDSTSSVARLVETSPLEWSKQMGNLLRVCRTKLSLVLARARPPILPHFNLRQRMGQISQLLADGAFCDQVLSPALELILAKFKANHHVMVVASGEARAESKELWISLSVSPPNEFIAIQLQHGEDFTVRNLGRPGFPSTAKFPWSFRVFDALQAAGGGTATLSILLGVMESMFGQRASVLANMRVEDYLHDLCSFSANRRVELELDEQVLVTKSWLDKAVPEWRTSLAAAHHFFYRENWAVFSLVSIRVALLDLQFPNGLFTVEQGMLTAFYSFMIDPQVQAQKSWLGTVHKIRAHVHANFLVRGKDDTLRFADLLFRAAHLEIFQHPFKLADGSNQGLLDFAHALPSNLPMLSKYVNRIAGDVVAQTWFTFEPFMHQLLDFVCFKQQDSTTLQVLLAICRHSELTNELKERIETHEYLFRLCVDLGEDLISDLEFFPPPQVKRICVLRHQLRALALGKRCAEAELEAAENELPRAFLFNELVALYGEFGMMEKITSCPELVAIFQTKHKPPPIVGSGGGKATILNVQRLNSGMLFFGEHLYREAQDLVQEYGGKPNKSLFPAGLIQREAKQHVVDKLFADVSARVSKAPCLQVLWHTNLLKMDHSFHVFVLAVLYAACMRIATSPQGMYTTQLNRFIDDLIYCFPAHLPHGTDANKRVYLHLAQLSCSDETSEVWQNLELTFLLSVDKRVLLIQLCIAGLLGESESGPNLFGEMLRSNVSKPQLAQLYIPCMANDELDEIRLALGYVGFWSCPQGHRYVVGECTMPMERGRCPECGASIGGQDHNPVKGVKRLEGLMDEGLLVKPGYFPPQPISMGEIRQVKPGAVAFYQLCLHAMFVVNRNMEWVFQVRQSTSKKELRFQAESLFVGFLRRFQDFAFAEAQVEVADADRELFLLGVLSLASRTTYHTLSTPVQRFQSLANRNSTEADLKSVWFASAAATSFVVQRIVQVKQMLGVASVKREMSNLVGTGFLGLAETLLLPEKTSASLWRFRSAVGLSTLASALELKRFQDYAFLMTFCETEGNLRLVTCLADVLEWSATLGQALALRPRKLTREEASQLTNAEAIRLFPSQAQQDQATEVLLRYCTAFNQSFRLVPFLYECQRNPFLTEQLEVDLGAGMKMSPSTPVAFSLVAIVQGDADAPSLCLFQLVRALQQLNNNLLDQLLEHNDAGVLITTEVPVTTMHTPRSVILSRLVQYDRERDLVPLLVVHGSSGKSNDGNNPNPHVREVDLPSLSHALSRQLMAGGKGPIRVVIPQFQYANEARRTGTLAVLKNRIPQVELSLAAKSALAQQLDSDSKIHPIMEMVDNAITFLSSFDSSAAFEGKMLLREFARSVLEADDDFNGLEQLALCHLASLFVWLEEAKLGKTMEELVHPRYRQTLDTGLGETLRQVATEFWDLDLLLPILKELLVNRLGEGSVFPQDAPLGEYLEYCTDVDLTALEWFAKHFPPALCLEHALAVWQVCVECAG